MNQKKPDKMQTGIPPTRRELEALAKEAQQWEMELAQESLEVFEAKLEQAELLETERLPRRPVSVRLDPKDLALLKRYARRKGIPHSQLIALWIHERLLQEQAEGGYN